MSYHQLQPLASKRNRVWVALCDTDNSKVIIKEFASDDSYNCEAAMVARLAAAGLAVPQVLEQSQGRLVYRHVAGSTLLALLEAMEGEQPPTELPTAFAELCRWLADFYTITDGNVILEDAHLRNFIASPQGVVGIDFECCTEGTPSQDIAKLLILTATYTPALTPLKLAMARLLYRELCTLLKLDATQLRSCMVTWQAEMARRRGVASPDWLPDYILE